MNYLTGRLVSLNCKCQWSNWRIGQNGAFENCTVEFARYKKMVLLLLLTEVFLAKDRLDQLPKYVKRST